MSFDATTLHHVALLARLPLSPDEEARFAREIPDILAAFEALPEAEPPVPPVAREAASRADAVTPAPEATRDAIVAALPRREGTAARVPRGLGAP